MIKQMVLTERCMVQCTGFNLRLRSEDIDEDRKSLGTFQQDG